MDKKSWKILGIVFTLIALVLVFLLIIILIVRNNRTRDDIKEKSNPSEKNTRLWATFPGKLNSSTTHTLNILEYTEDRKNVSIKEKIELNETTEYDNFNFNKKEKKVFFDAKSEFKLVKGEVKEDIETINSINLGMFETLETLSNPPLYQKGINSIHFLFNKAFQSPDSFIKHIFTFYCFKTFIKYEDQVYQKIFVNVEQDKAKKVYSDDEKYSKYSFKSISGFYEWVKILGVEEEINRATWLKDLFEFNSEEINSVFGKDHYLYNEFINFNKELATEYKCKKTDFCGNELIYTQIINGNVLSNDNLKLDGLISLYKEINPEYYPFVQSPELYLYFEDYKKNVDGKNLEYKDYEINENTLEKLIDPNSQFSLLNANNSALFLSLIQINNTEKISELYGLTSKQSLFLCSYFFEFLPKLFIYQEFKDKDGKLTNINPSAKAFSTITENIIEKTYYKLRNDRNIYNLLLSKLIWRGLHYEIFNLSMEYDDEDICPLIMQQALDDGKKVLTICSDPVTAFNSPEEILKWFDPYYCIKSGNESDCNMTIINYLKSIVYITEDEIKSIYEQNNIGQIFEESDQALKEAYNCKEEKCDNEYFAKMQFWNSYVSQNIPFFSKVDSLSQLFPDVYPYPMELKYFANQLDFHDEIPENDVNYLISLSPNKTNNLLNEDNYEAFNNKLNLEKEYTMFMDGNKNDDINSKYITINILNNGFLFSNNINTKYENTNNLIQGSCTEDKKYLDFLSNGPFYENYKPGINKTTGFNFGINLKTGEENNINYDRYGICTEDGKNLRKIIDINDCPVLNIKKLEYNYLTKEYSYINSPIFNFQTLTGDKSFIDGFQYNHEEDTIFYYDKISSRPYKFIFSEKVDYEDQTCRKYKLDINDLANINEKDDLNKSKAFISQKLNKPYIVTVGKEEFSPSMEENIPTNNFICVEPYTNMVLDSNINFVYSIYTKNYGYINSNIENEKIYPIFIYNRNYKVNIDSFNSVFNEINDYKSFRKVFIIVFLVLILLFLILACFCFYKCYFYRRSRTIILGDPNEPTGNLINESRDTTSIEGTSTKMAEL